LPLFKALALALSGKGVSYSMLTAQPSTSSPRTVPLTPNSRPSTWMQAWLSPANVSSSVAKRPFSRPAKRASGNNVPMVSTASTALFLVRIGRDPPFANRERARSHPGAKVQR
jgi:hypothetical protein